MLKIIVPIIVLWLTLTTGAVEAVTLPAPTGDNATVLTGVNTSLSQAVTKATGDLQTQAIKWLSLFVLIQTVLTNIGLLKSGAEIEAVLGKLAGSMLWFSFCYYVMLNGAQFIDSTAQAFFVKADAIAGGSGKFDVGSIIGHGADAAAALISKITDAASLVSLVPAAILAGLLGLFIMGVSIFLAFKVFLLKVEVMLVVMLSPLSFSFLGLNALKDQGIAPFKSLISLLYRIILIAVVLSALGTVGSNLDEVINSVDKTSWLSGMWSALFAATAAYILLGLIAYKSDSIASSLASGGTNLGSGDVASAAAMGAAAGAAVATGGAAAVAGASKAGSPMSEVIKNMMGSGGGSIANASPSGTGGASNPPPPPPKSPEMSFKQMQEHPSNIANQGGESAGGGSPAQAPSSESGQTTAPNQSPAEQNSANATAMSSVPGSLGGSDGSGSTTKAPPDSSPSAGIGGSAGATDEKLDKLIASLGQAKKPSVGERMGTLNDHVAREQATTHVSINTNAGD